MIFEGTQQGVLQFPAPSLIQQRVVREMEQLTEPGLELGMSPRHNAHLSRCQNRVFVAIGVMS